MLNTEQGASSIAESLCLSVAMLSTVQCWQKTNKVEQRAGGAPQSKEPTAGGRGGRLGPSPLCTLQAYDGCHPCS